MNSPRPALCLMRRWPEDRRTPVAAAHFMLRNAAVPHVVHKSHTASLEAGTSVECSFRHISFTPAQRIPEDNSRIYLAVPEVDVRHGHAAGHALGTVRRQVMPGPRAPASSLLVASGGSFSGRWRHLFTTLPGPPLPRISARAAAGATTARLQEPGAVRRLRAAGSEDLACWTRPKGVPDEKAAWCPGPLVTLCLFALPATPAQAEPTAVLERDCAARHGVTVKLSGFPPNTGFSSTLDSPGGLTRGTGPSRPQD